MRSKLKDFLPKNTLCFWVHIRPYRTIESFGKSFKVSKRSNDPIKKLQIKVRIKVIFLQQNIDSLFNKYHYDKMTIN